MPNWPATGLDSLPRPNANTNRDDPGFALHTVIGDLSTLAERNEARWGLDAGSTTPDAQFKSILATAAGRSAWGYSSYVKLGEVSGTGSSGVLEIASIPAFFRTLELHLVGRSDTAASFTVARLTFETSPTAGAYDHEALGAGATSVSAAENIGTSDFIQAGLVPGANSSANCYGFIRMLLPEYANTGFFKPVQCVASEILFLNSGNIAVRIASGVWESTAAISRVRLTLAAGNWTAASRLSLYGIPG